jgi:hypothetical protein
MDFTFSRRDVPNKLKNLDQDSGKVTVN